MKALSLWQPWASAIALGYKRHETRSWPTRYRGPIAIHAAKRWTPEEREDAADFARILGDERLRDPPLGSIVAIGTITDCIPAERIKRDSIGEDDWMLGNFGPGRFAWRLEHVRGLIEPIPLRGEQGIFSVPDNLVTPNNMRLLR